MIGVAASGSAVEKLNICAKQHIVVVFLNVWCGSLHYHAYTLCAVGQ